MRGFSAVWPYVIATLVVAAAALIIYLLHLYTKGVQLGSLLLFSTIFISYRYGFRPGFYAALLSSVLYLLAVGASNTTTFLINAIVGYGGAALLTSIFVGRMREELGRAQGRARISSILLAAAQDLAAAPDEPAVRARLARHLTQAARTEAVVRGDLREFCEERGLVSGPLLDNLVQAEQRLRAIGRFTQQIGPWDVRTLTAGDDNLGIAAWKRSDLDPEEQTLLAVLADTGALAIARGRAT
jgi:K+-sensing histidine kinase KdpD